MKRIVSVLVILILSLTIYAQRGQVWKLRKDKDGNPHLINTAIDNIAYWQKLAQQGIVPVNPQKKAPPAIWKGSKINSAVADFEDSPDVIIEDGTDNTQSENSIFIDPNDAQHALNSNNSTDWDGSQVNDLYGTSAFQTSDGGETWSGQIEGTGGYNWGDPATAISTDGKMYIGYIIANSFGQGVAHSYDAGNTWTGVTVYDPGDGQDKNHLWIDNVSGSPYNGYIYDAWSDLNSSMHIYFARSTDNGQTWTNPPIDISSAVNSGSHDQGVNLAVGPNGEVYAVWAIYDSWPAPETAIGFNKSTDGGATWGTATRIITNIQGIRQESGPGGVRTNSFPVMDVDLNTGTIYVVWTNIGEPGVNSGDNWSIYMIKSEDGGQTWSDPIRVNQGPTGDGYHALFPWIAVDPATGYITVIFWDNRNTGSTDQVEVFVAVSMDGGETWEDFRVSDVAFSPEGISGLASGYFGDYIGIDVQDGVVYPVWSDNRSGVVKAYTSPFSLNTRPRPFNLIAELVNEQTGETHLTWNFVDTAGTFLYFVLYRNGDSIAMTTDTTYVDYLPSYGTHKYQVFARHSTGLSSPANATVTWGKAIISVNPQSLAETLGVDQSVVRQLYVQNSGQLPLYYNIKTEFTSKYDSPKDYCSASGGGDEYISGVEFGDINITSGENDYEDHTDLSTVVEAGGTYTITIHNGNPYSSDDYAVWIDFNQDMDFDDPGEQVVCAPDAGNASTQTFQITIPEDAMAGATRMRIRLKWSGSDCGDPCGSTTYGEVEDYTVIINSWLSVGNRIDTVNPGETVEVPVTFQSYNMQPGYYSANLKFYSNAEDTVIVPVSLVITDSTLPLEVSPTAVPQNICNGDSTTLYANASGGSGNYTYSWTGDDGFTSSDANPVVSPEQTTTYTVEVNDGNETVSGSVTVNVLTAPSKPAKPVGSVNVGNHTELVKYYTSADNAQTYEWKLNPSFVGNIVGYTDTAYVNFNSNYTGTVYLKVRAINDCGISDWSDSLEITLFEGTLVIMNEVALALYPNPNNGQFKLMINSKMSDYFNIEIYNSLGQKVYADYNRKFEGYNVIEINVGDLPSGIYYLKLTGRDVNHSLKFIIE